MMHRNRKLGKLGSIVICLWLTAGCVHRAADPKDQIVARVNGESLTLREFLLNFSQLKGEQDEISAKNPKLVEQLKIRALNEVVIMKLLRQEAAKKKLKVAKEEVEGRLDNWKESYPVGGWAEMLRKQNTTEDFLKRRIEDQLLVEKITTELFGAETRVSDEEMQKYFKSHEEDFSRPEKVHVFQIVVPSKEEAQKIRGEVMAGKLTFESAARQYSLSPDAAKGGDLGFFSRNEKIAAFNEAFKLAVGAISDPIQSRYGIHLLKVVERIPAKKLNYNEAKNDIVRDLKKAKEIKVYQEWVTKLLKDGEIYRNEVLFASIT
jgi:parvulin-like peptidyl-prolyl isomerase